MFKAKDLTLKAKDSKFALEDTSRTKAKDINTGLHSDVASEAAEAI